MYHDPNLLDPTAFRVRATDRAGTHLTCTIRRSELGDVAAEVHDLSPAGALLVSAEPLAHGSHIAIYFGKEAEPVHATVKWSAEDRHGCKFIRTLTARHFLRLHRGPEVPQEAVRPGLAQRLRQLLPSRR
jgi:hypothetical protein